MVASTLREGFAEAHRHPGLILLDVIWKFLWLILTFIGLLIVLYQFMSHFEWNPVGIRALDALTLANTFRQLWNDYGGEFLGGVVAVTGMSSLVYLLVEAKVRRKFVVAGFRPGLDRGLRPTTTSVSVFVASSLARLAILGSAIILLGLIADSSTGATIAAIIAFAAFAFLLTIIDTLVRNDAIDLLGADFIGITGVIGTLVLFETLINTSLIILLATGFFNVSDAGEALGMLAVTGLVLFIVIFLHSYLLIVRFSAVGIMRRNVINV